MNDTISMYQLSCNQYEKHLNEFRKKKTLNFKEEIVQKEKGRLDWDEMSQQDNQTIKSTQKKKNVNYTHKMQSGGNLNAQKLNSNIIILDLSNARLTALSEQMGNLALLQIINLANNLFLEIPPILLDLSLVHININNNLLKSVQIGKKWNDSLERMDLGKNHIRNLPDSLFKLEKIQMLDLRSNDFNKIPISLLKLKSKLYGLGLDWVKYSHDRYFPNRKDILIGDDLYRFWEIIFKISKNQNDFISCYEFLLINDKWDEDIIPEMISAQLPKQSYINKASHKLSELTLQDYESFSYQHQNNRTQAIDVDSLNGSNLMHICVKNEDLGVLRTLLHSKFYMADQMDEEDQTPLSLAIQEEKYHCAKIFINSNVDVNNGGGPFKSILNQAVSKMQYYLIRDILNLKVIINKQDKRGNGPLHNLIPSFKKNINEATKIGFLLVENGANGNLVNNNHNTPLHLAIKKSYFSAVKFALQCNQKYSYQIFSFKLLGNKLNSIMHFAAKSENIKIILQLYPLNPYLLFTYNAEGKRPFDIIQKNYTLSKLLQVLELIYIKKKITTLEEQVQQQLPNQLDLQRPVLSRKGSWNLDESDDEHNCIKMEMNNFQMQPKLKSNQITFQNTTKQKSNKVSEESIEPIVINKSIQQGRNDIKWIEKQNSLNQNQMPSCNKQIHKMLADLEIIQKFMMEQQIDLRQKRVLLRISRHIREQLQLAKTDPLNNMLLENAEELQKFHFMGQEEQQLEINKDVVSSFELFQQQN